MIKNYFITAFRNIKRQRGYSLINIAGLAIGITCCLLMFLWVQDELSYDRFHEDAEDIYRVITETHGGEQIFNQARTPNALAPALEKEYPEVLHAARFRGGRAGGWLVKYGDKAFMDDRLGTADPSFFDVFKFPFIKGNPKTALNERFSMVITESMVKKYFGDDDPLGKVINLDGTDMKVTGVIKDVPANSHIQFDYVFPIINMAAWWGEDFKSWERFRFQTYVKLRANSSGEEVSQKIADIIKNHLPGSKNKVYLQPLSEVHLYSDLKWDEDNIGQGNITYVYIFSLTAFLILLIACINFMNLSTARSAKRTKEVGLRKVVGAGRIDLIKQFIGESIILSFIALLCAVILAYLFLPVFGRLSEKALTLNLWGNVQILFQLIVITLLTGIIAGSYPALFLSSFQPARVLAGVSDVGKRRGGALRKVLVVVQFTITIVLIIGTIVIYSQLNFIRNKPLGFDKDHVLYFAPSGPFDNNYEVIMNELLQNPNIRKVSNSYPPILTFRGTTQVDWEGKSPDKELMIHPSFVDYDYLETFNMKMADGRFFSRDFSTDASNYVLNETAVKMMGIKSPVGKWFTYNGQLPNREPRGIIIGVIKDFHQGSLHQEIPPSVLKIAHVSMRICVKISPDNVSGTIKFLEDKWKKLVPNYPFTYSFIDETIDQFYNNERRLGAVFRYFAILAIFISCLGLLGLASYLAERRTKEIGIRKALGASVPGIVILLSKEFVKWVIIAFVIASPLAVYFMNQWLQDFAYRIGMEWWIFVFAGGIALVLAVLTVSYQTIKAAQNNPVNSLKYE